MKILTSSLLVLLLGFASTAQPAHAGGSRLRTKADVGIKVRLGRILDLRSATTTQAALATGHSSDCEPCDVMEPCSSCETCGPSESEGTCQQTGARSSVSARVTVLGVRLKARVRLRARL